MKIIGVSGRKQSGKNTVANFVNGEILKNRSMIKDFYIDEFGKLIVETTDSSGEWGYGEFDVTRKDEAFVKYAHIELWPYVKVYHFADPLKDLSIDLFGFDPSHVYGSDDQKNMPSTILWDNMPNNHSDKHGLMSYREFLEHFGTNILRKIKNDIWSEYTIKRITSEQSEIAIIPDVRFPNEVEAIKKIGGTVIRLTRNVHNSNSTPETSLDQDKYDWANFDLIIDNHEMNLNELCSTLKANSWMWS